MYNQFMTQKKGNWPISDLRDRYVRGEMYVFNLSKDYRSEDLAKICAAEISRKAVEVYAERYGTRKIRHKSSS